MRCIAALFTAIATIALWTAALADEEIIGPRLEKPLQAGNALAESRYGEAERLFVEIYEKDRENSGALMGLVSVWKKTLPLERIPGRLKKIIAAHPEASAGHYTLAWFYATEPQLPLDDDAMKRAAGKFPGNPEMLMMIGNAFFMRMRNAEALPHLETALRLKPGLPNLPGMIAAAYHDLENKRRVKTELKARFEADPQDLAAAVALGVIAYYDEDYESTLKYLLPLQKVFPDEPRMWIYPMMSHFNLGRQDEAEKVLEEAYRFTDDSDVHYCAATIYRKKDPQRALKELNAFLEMNENMPQRHPPKLKRVKHMRREILCELENDCEFRPDEIDDLRGPGTYVAAALAVLLLAALAIVFYRQAKSRKNG